MKAFNRVELINDKTEYQIQGVHKGMIGHIIDPICPDERYKGFWEVQFETSEHWFGEVVIIKETDLKYLSDI